MNHKTRIAFKAGAALIAAAALIVGSVAGPAQAAKKEYRDVTVSAKKEYRDTGWGPV